MSDTPESRARNVTWNFSRPAGGATLDALSRLLDAKVGEGATDTPVAFEVRFPFATANGLSAARHRDIRETALQLTNDKVVTSLYPDLDYTEVDFNTEAYILGRHPELTEPRAVQFHHLEFEPDVAAGSKSRFLDLFVTDPRKPKITSDEQSLIDDVRAVRSDIDRIAGALGVQQVRPWREAVRPNVTVGFRVDPDSDDPLPDFNRQLQTAADIISATIPIDIELGPTTQLRPKRRPE